MFLCTFFIFLIIIIIILCIIYSKNEVENMNQTLYKQIRDTFQNHSFSDELKYLNKCQVPTLNTEQCYKSHYYECPIVNGSYLQCTNNYLPKPTNFNAPCNNRTFEMTPYPEKISENCYYQSIGFDRDQFKLNLPS